MFAVGGAQFHQKREFFRVYLINFAAQALFPCRILSKMVMQRFGVVQLSRLSRREAMCRKRRMGTMEMEAAVMLPAADRYLANIQMGTQWGKQLFS